MCDRTCVDRRRGRDRTCAVSESYPQAAARPDMRNDGAKVEVRPDMRKLPKIPLRDRTCAHNSLRIDWYGRLSILPPTLLPKLEKIRKA
jgi:hypothetical protein